MGPFLSPEALTKGLRNLLDRISGLAVSPLSGPLWYNEL